MRVLDLFSGIGGFSLGLERAGFETVAFCECEPFCQQVLRKHWPDIPIYDDVRELTHERLTADGIRGVDVVCGGFPCQDISVAGKGAGIEGERSGLWSEFARLIGELRPRYAIVENVSALLGRGLSRVLGDLAEIGYDAEWYCIPASAVGAPHRRERVWIIAHACRSRLEGIGNRRNASLAHGDDKGCEFGGTPVAPIFADAIGWQLAQCGKARRVGRKERFSRDSHWPITSEPFVCRGGDGVPNRVDRLKGLGNAVVPQIPEMIGRAILSEEYAVVVGVE